jgi:hypothetical protein
MPLNSVRNFPLAFNRTSFANAVRLNVRGIACFLRLLGWLIVSAAVLILAAALYAAFWIPLPIRMRIFH